MQTGNHRRIGIPRGLRAVGSLIGPGRGAWFGALTVALVLVATTRGSTAPGPFTTGRYDRSARKRPRIGSCSIASRWPLA